MKLFSHVAVVGLTTALAAVPAVASSQRATTPEDIARIAYVSVATISHRGDRAAFVVTKLDPEADRYVRNLWLVRSDGAACRGRRKLPESSGFDSNRRVIWGNPR